MALYAVHCASAAPSDLANARFVKQGFYPVAFVFAPFWLLLNRLWAAFGLWLAATLAVSALSEAHALVPGAGIGFNVLLAFFVGFQASSWLNARVSRDGKPEVEIVAARNAAEAERAFFARVASRPAAGAQTSTAPPSTVQPRSPIGAVIGLFPEVGR